MAEKSALIPNPTMYTQADKLKEVQDMSKTLVGGDFERQCRSLEKSRKRKCFLIFGISISALVVWLLVLTVVRELQMARLNEELLTLKTDFMTMSARVVSLNEKITSNRLYNEFKNVEDTFYADEDQDNFLNEFNDLNKDKQNSESIDKLDGLTVLEDDSSQASDDEDLYDGDDDAESGDWYPDYDRRREKIGTTNMIRLKPEDFTDTVMKQELSSNLKELKRLLNENPEIENIALPAQTSTEADKTNRDKRSLFSDATPESISDFPVPKVMGKTDDRYKMKKPVAPSEVLGRMPVHKVSRIARNSDEDGRRAFVAAHFHGNTTHLNTESHQHYKGNGLLKLPHGEAHNVWYPAPWTMASPHPRPTLTNKGHIHVHHTGVYLVYVQIYYLDSHDVISWVLHRTNIDIDGRETLLQCAQSTHSSERLEKPNSCFSAAALFLKAGDRLAVRNTGGDRHSLMQPEKSFIGLIKLADAEEPNFDM